jgi:hypothetical protein
MMKNKFTNIAGDSQSRFQLHLQENQAGLTHPCDNVEYKSQKKTYYLGAQYT